MRITKYRIKGYIMSAEEWDLMKRLNASVIISQEKLSSIILESDFSNKEFAQEIAISVFEITDENIKLYKSTAKKLLSFRESDKWGIACCFRQELLNQLIKGKRL